MFVYPRFFNHTFFYHTFIIYKAGFTRDVFENMSLNSHMAYSKVYAANATNFALVSHSP